VVLGGLRAVAAALLLGFLGYQLWQARGALGPNLHLVGWRTAAAATVLASLAGLPGFFGWRLLLARLGTRLPWRTALRLYLLAGLTRYLPGGLWPAVTHAALARSLGESPARLGGGYAAAQGLGAIAGLGVGLVALPRLTAAHAAWWLLLPVLLAALVPVVSPRLLAAVFGVALRVLRRPGRRPVLPDRRTLLTVTGLTVVGWLGYGLHITLLAVALGADPVGALTVGTGGFALSVVAGAVAAVLPAGLGVREVVLGLTLATLVTGPALVTLVALSRVLMTLGDLLGTTTVLGALALTGRLHRPRPAPRPAEEPAG
jgi:uncharacterized membrane protein YbhN (UPF0104 family)